MTACFSRVASTLPGAAAVVLLALPAAAQAGPRGDPSARLAERLCRLERLPCVLGASDHSRLRQAERMVLREGDASASARWLGLAPDLAPELRVASGQGSWRAPPWRLEPTGLLSVGSLAPLYRSGDQEPGLFSLRAGGQGRVYPGILEATVGGVGTLDVADELQVGLDVPDAWAGVASHGLVAGFGLRDRHIGPGRFGSLMLSDHARPAPLGSLAWTSAPGRFGRVHLEAGGGWIPGQREDVQRPGWLLLDLRYQPLPELELGATRVGIFGGQGRPTPSLGQILLPTDPHVYDDPDRVEPDQDEMAALDLRVMLPVGRWAGLSATDGHVDGVDVIELWWQYGGEDVIGRQSLGLPYPALAGIANLFGGEVSAGPLVVTAEHARLLDDYFRWYTGHRVYHQGFTREGLSMGHASGGDAISNQVAVAWEAGPWGLELTAGRQLRVGVIEALGANLLALSTDELRHRVGLGGWVWTDAGWWVAKVELERIIGEDFVAGADGWTWRVAIGR